MRKLKNGWVKGSVPDFLDLSDADREYMETRRALGRQVRAGRQEQGLTQTALAARLQTSQSRVGKMEAADASVTIDLLLQTLFRLGMERSELAKAI